MNINRHNYEEFFILYWDNELNVQQKKLVEIFVQENTDLQDEFRLFGETRFTPEENISFAGKENLLNKEIAFINPANYQEHLLSYIDGELNNKEKNLVENFSALHPSVQLELALLQKTKIQPETEIVFPDKSILYRKEEKVRVIRMTWLRVAVAAVLILMAGLVTFRLITNSKKDDKPEIAKTITPVQKTPEQEIKRNATADNNVAGEINSLSIVNPVENKKDKVLQKENKAVENNTALVKPENKNNLPKEKNKKDQSLIAKNDFTTNNPDETNSTTAKKIDANEVAVTQTEKSKDFFSNNSVTESNVPPLNNQTATNAQFANYQEEPSNNKGGLKGFLRKATRVFERRTKIQTTTDDNKLLVGVFAVSLK